MEESTGEKQKETIEIPIMVASRRQSMNQSNGFLKGRVKELERENDMMLNDIRALWAHNQHVKQRLQDTNVLGANFRRQLRPK